MFVEGKPRTVFFLRIGERQMTSVALVKGITQAERLTLSQK